MYLMYILKGLEEILVCLLMLAVLGRLPSGCGAVHGLLIAAAPLLVEQRL